MLMHNRIEFTEGEERFIYERIKYLADKYFGDGNYVLHKVNDRNAPRYKVVPKLFDCNGKFALRLQCKNLVRFRSVEFLLNKYSNNSYGYGMRVQVCGDYKGYRKKNCEMYRIVGLEEERSFLVLEHHTDIAELFGQNTTSLFERVLDEIKNAKPTKIELNYWK